jgi:hypothetical protein
MIDKILTGEVVAGYPPTHIENRSGVRWEYTVKCLLPNGTYCSYPYAVMVEMFSGLMNYHQQVLPCSADATVDGVATIEPEGVRSTTVGARCVVAFPSGDTRSPIILGLLPHESSPVVVDRPVMVTSAEAQLKSNSVYPSFVSVFNGMEFKVNEIGEYFITHNGPTVIETEMHKSLTLTPPNPLYSTTMQFLEKGEWLVEDSLGQSVVIDPDLKTITIGNIENTILLDQEGKLLSLSTSGNFEEIVIGKCYRFVGDSEKIEIKNVFEFKSKEAKFESDKFWVTSKDTKLDDGKAKLTLKSGKVAFGAGSTELVDTLIKVFDQFINNAATIVSTGVGPGVLNPSVVSALTQLKTAWSQIKGSL